MPLSQVGATYSLRNSAALSQGCLQCMGHVQDAPDPGVCIDAAFRTIQCLLVTACNVSPQELLTGTPLFQVCA